MDYEKLDVPYEEKDEAKALGARWYKEDRTWGIPNGTDPVPLLRWRPRDPSTLRAKPGRYLGPDLVPRTCWFSNVRSHVSKEEWDTVKRAVFSAAKHRCEICGGRGPEWPVECHEVWMYSIPHEESDEPVVGRQTLIGCEALCPRCHETKHFGLARVNGRAEDALAWMMQINGQTREEAEEDVNRAFEVWFKRSSIDWTLDVSWLESNFGIVVTPER